MLAGAGFLLIGWSGLLMPSLIRDIESDFGQSDAGFGVFLFVNASAYASGSLVGGLLIERFGRRVVLTIAALSVAAGLVTFATVPSWPIFLAAAIPFGAGAGAIDGGMNGLGLDLYPTSRGRALNLLHLFYSVGALMAPLVVGRLLEAGVAWQVRILGTGLAAVSLAVAFAVVALPSGRHSRTDEIDGEPHGTRIAFSWPLIALAVAIACYVASELGVSNWLVRFLDGASVGLATAALSLFWASIALGRLASAKWSDRFDHARLASIASLAAAIALVAATLVPSLPASIVLFGVVGFALGPIYPLIMAVAGDRFPGRSAAVSGFLSGFAVVGAIAYPPVMGFISVGIGLAAAMLGAAVLALVCAVVLWWVSTLRTGATGTVA
jgi:fucose permease